MVQPALRVLPLTALNDALRATMLEGAEITAVLPELGILAAWLVVRSPSPCASSAGLEARSSNRCEPPPVAAAKNGAENGAPPGEPCPNLWNPTRRARTRRRS